MTSILGLDLANRNNQLAGISLVSSAASLANGLFAVEQAEEMARERLKAARPLVRARARQALRLREAQRLAYVAGGVDPNRGTPVDVIAETALEEGLQVAGIMHRARVEAFDIRRAGLRQLSRGFSSSANTFAQAASGMKPPPEEIPVSKPEEATVEQINQNLLRVLDPIPGIGYIG